MSEVTIPASPDDDGAPSDAERIEAAIARTLADGILGGDLGGSHGTAAIGAAVRERL